MICFARASFSPSVASCDSASATSALIRAFSRLRIAIGQAIEAALSEVRPSVNAWFETARNVALFANDDGHVRRTAHIHAQAPSGLSPISAAPPAQSG